MWTQWQGITGHVNSSNCAVSQNVPIYADVTGQYKARLREQKQDKKRKLTGDLAFVCEKVKFTFIMPR
jgi:hypothetical protein